MPRPTIESVAATYFRREGSVDPAQRIQSFMSDYDCEEGEAQEIISTMNMLVTGCFQEMKEAAHTQKSERDAAEAFLTTVNPQMSAEAKSEIIRHASWCVSK